ncbi:MAG: DUF4349 domain-containing protein [Eubacteriales bacterium]|nr:DUF4349 domain-containing protein [Eubacteriales bacterium]
MVRNEKGRMKKMSKRFVACIIASLICVGATGCGSSSTYKNEAAYESYDSGATSDVAYNAMGMSGIEAAEVTDSKSVDDSYAEDSYTDDYTEDVAESGSSDHNQNSNYVKQNDKKKIIKRYNYSYETEKFDDAYAFLKQQIDSYQGYISASEVRGKECRSLYLTARIPADVSDSFVSTLGNLGTLESQTESAEDITLQYADTESRIASIKTEQERLLVLLDKADTLETIIELEKRLTDVRYELENYESQRKLYDDLVSYSTVTIQLQEVVYTVEVDDSTFISRIKTGLERSLRDVRYGFTDFIVFIIINIPYFIVWGIIIFVLVLVVRKIIKVNRKRKEKRAQKKAEKKAKQEKKEEKREEILLAEESTNNREEEK